MAVLCRNDADSSLAVLLTYTVAALAISVFYKRFVGCDISNVTWFGTAQKILHGAQLFVALVALVAHISSGTSDSVWEGMLMALAAVVVSGLLLAWAIYHRSAAQISLETTVEELGVSLMALEEELVRTGGLSPKWSARQLKWRSRVRRARTSDMLAHLLIKLERHVTPLREDAVFTRTRRNWAEDVIGLIPQTMRVRLTKIPEAAAKDGLVYCRVIPYSSRFYRTLSSVPYQRYSEKAALERLLTRIQSLSNTVSSTITAAE
eukprot:PhM_4_TR15213/c1_g1_i1/m.1718